MILMKAAYLGFTKIGLRRRASSYNKICCAHLFKMLKGFVLSNECHVVGIDRSWMYRVWTTSHRARTEPCGRPLASFLVLLIFSFKQGITWVSLNINLYAACIILFHYTACYAILAIEVQDYCCVSRNKRLLINNVKLEMSLIHYLRNFLQVCHY